MFSLSIFFVVLLFWAVEVDTASIPYSKSEASGAAKGFTDDGMGTEVAANFNMEKCTISYGSEAIENVINLMPLARQDGLPRFNATFNVSIEEYSSISSFNYSFNPCIPYSLPRHNPHVSFGDGCHNAIVCKYNYNQESSNYHFYTLGIRSQELMEVKGWEQANNETHTSLIFKGVLSMRMAKTEINLICDPKRSSLEVGLFRIVKDAGRGSILAELHHKCCCPGGCTYEAPSGSEAGSTDMPNAASSKDKKKKKADNEIMLVIVGTVVGLLLSVILIGGLCYVKRTHIQFYSKLPGIRAVPPNSNLSTPGQGLTGDGKNTDFRDYEPSALSGVRHKLIPVLEDPLIQSSKVEMNQRLGGGIFGDTHLGRWNGMTVTVKRLTLSIHHNQLTSEMMQVMKEEVSWISRQRHKNIVCVLGLSLDGRLPFLMTEYVLGDCVRDFIKSNNALLTWPQRVRMCHQVADGVAFLHNTKPPIIHRDLRCGNLFISEHDLVKVADFSLTKLLQPMREQCDQDDCNCMRLMSACPATIRWTAPELLLHPRAKEGESSTISTACDVYSFGMVLWEMVVARDPFYEMKTDTEVIEVVKNGGRPEISPGANILSPYKDLMKVCWDQRPSLRPPFKQVAVKLKEMISAARSHQRQISNKNCVQKSQSNVASI